MFYKHTPALFRKRFLSIIVLSLCCPVIIKAQRSSDNTLQTLGHATITIDLSKKYQTIDNFAASDAWACQFVGNWPEQKKNAIADLLFSQKILASGQPAGIGLSLWRFNVGAGSTQQAEASGIKDAWRRAESFLDKEGNYDWNLQSGQMWFLKAAKERGVKQFLAFPNSPPVQITTTQKAFATASKPNLAPGKFGAFADYLAAVIKGVYTKTGVMFNYISPVNEPQWDWSNGGQEGTPFNNKDISGIVKALDSALAANSLPSKIIVTEAGQYNFLYSSHKKSKQGKQIDAFFNPVSTNYIGGLTSVEKLICGHSYFTTSPYSKAVSIRKKLAEKVSSINGLKFWQSEYCILGDNEGEMKGEKKDLGIEPALYLARVIHNDLVNANASAWQWWLAISPYDYKDGLIYIDQNKQDGNYYPSKMLWALGNYSRFIPPGSVRVDVTVTGSDPAKLFISSYQDVQSGEVISVIVNSDNETRSVVLKLKDSNYQSLSQYNTTSTADLAPGKSIMQGEEVIIPAKSITTLITHLK